MSLVDQISEALSKVQDPELRKPITELGMVEDLQEKNGAVIVTILLTISACPMQDRLRNDVTAAIRVSVTVFLTPSRRNPRVTRSPTFFARTETISSSGE